MRCKTRALGLESYGHKMEWLLVLGLASGLGVALAQQGDDPLNGYWKQVGES
ncbi:MAG: hypothetical protein ACJATK_001913, partial [Paracoccaceae bacterium]